MDQKIALKKIGRLQGTLFKLIGQLESCKLLIHDERRPDQKKARKKMRKKQIGISTLKR